MEDRETLRSQSLKLNDLFSNNMFVLYNDSTTLNWTSFDIYRYNYEFIFMVAGHSEPRNRFLILEFHDENNFNRKFLSIEELLEMCDDRLKQFIIFNLDILLNVYSDHR
jgi:hypothetical protein